MRRQVLDVFAARGDRARRAAPARRSGGQAGQGSETRGVRPDEPAGRGTRSSSTTAPRNGLLTPAGTYATGGLGGPALPGTESDPLASQGSLVYARRRRVLIAVNAGSDTVSRSACTETCSSCGRRRFRRPFPASIAVHTASFTC